MKVYVPKTVVKRMASARKKNQIPRGGNKWGRKYRISKNIRYISKVENLAFCR